MIRLNKNNIVLQKANLLLTLVIICTQFIYIQPGLGQIPFFQETPFSKDLNNITINSISQDITGLIWFGTSEGLYSSNGLDLLKYDLYSFDSVENISIVTSMNDSSIWIGTMNGGVGFYKEDIINPVIVPSDSFDFQITGIVTLSDTNRLIATYGGGLYQYTNQTLLKLKYDELTEIDDIYSILKDKSGKIWLGTDNGIIICKPTETGYNFSNLDQSNGLPDNIVRILREDQKGDIWIGMHQSGICKYLINENKIDQSSISKEWDHGQVNAIGIINETTLWIGTQGDGIIEYLFDGTGLWHYSLNNDENESTYVNDLFIDDEGNGWISDNISGLYTSNPSILKFNFEDITDEKNIQALVIDKNNNIWFSTSNGLFEYRPIPGQTGLLIQHMDFFNKDLNIISLYADQNNDIWAGTFGSGLYQYNPSSKTVSTYQEKDGLCNNNVLSITGNEHFLWFATLGGVSKIELKQLSDPSGRNKLLFNNYHDESGLSTEYIYQAYIDSKGKVWFATDGKGLVVFSEGIFTRFSASSGLNSKIIYSITEDKSGNIWLSSARDGIYRFDGNQFINYTLADGLSSHTITTLACTKNNEILIVHNEGIDILNPSSEIFRHYGKETGLGQIDPDLNVLTYTNSNDILFGTQSGLYQFRSSMEKSRTQPIIVLKDLLVMMTPFRKSEALNLRYNENFLTFQYSGFWYTQPEQMSFQYKLENLDQSWVNTKDMFVNYSNLSPGTYTFNVRVGIDNQFTGADTTSVTINIDKPYYNKLWFYVLIIFSAVLIVTAIAGIRDRQLKKKAAIEKERYKYQFESLRSQINPHFLFNSFNTLITLIEENPKLAMQFTEHLSDFFRDILQLRDRDLILLKEEISFVENYFELLKNRFGQNLNLIIKVSTSLAENSYIPPLTLQMLVENAIKHNVVSTKHPLTFEINGSEGFLTVQNKIQLKKNPETSTKIGLRNILNQFNLIAGKEVHIEQSEGYFKVIIPLLKKV